MLPTIMTCSSFIRNEAVFLEFFRWFFCRVCLVRTAPSLLSEMDPYSNATDHQGASEYANGDLSYRIPVKSEDEMGYLAKTLNYMADRINQNGEYQRTFIANVSHDSALL